MRAEDLHWTILIALLAGLALSIFAWQETVNPGLQGVCSVNPIFSCTAVDRSGHNTIFGVPDYLIGIGGFLLMLAIDIPLMLTWKRSLLKALIVVSSVGVAVSIYLAAVEAFVIGAFCPICLGTYVANGIALAAAIALYRQGRPDKSGAPATEKGQGKPDATG